MDEGITIQPQKIGGNNILVGRAGDIFPVLFMCGGPKAISNPYPALSKQFVLSAKETQTLIWALVSQGSQEESFEEARTLTATNWRKQASDHVRQHDAHTVHINTGDSDWDAAFSLAQKIAMTHLAISDTTTNHPLFLKTRLPDQSLNKIISVHSVEELTILEASQLAQILIPTRVDHMSSLLVMLLERFDEEGISPLSNDLVSPGPSFRACPMIAHLFMECLKIEPDEELLKRVFPLLETFIDNWIPQDIDRLDNEFPVFETPQQLQLNTGDFKFDAWHKYGGGLDIQTVISPALAAMLYCETSALQKLAHRCKDRKAQKHFNGLRKFARNKLNDCWHDETKMFTYQDHQSHRASTREWVAYGKVQRIIPINRQFSFPQKLICHLYAENEETRTCVLSFEGISETGELLMEEIKIPSYRWIMGSAHITTHFLFDELQTVAIEGLSPNDRFMLENVDHFQPDITCLLPIWSGGASKKSYEAMIQSQRENLTQSWNKGIPETWEGSNSLPEELPISVNVLWNTLIIEGMLHQGFLEEATDVFTNLMGTIIQGLKDFDGFFPYYDSQTGQPAGPKNAITGLPPLKLFLEIAGIKLFTPHRLAIWGTNPFPWPLAIQWQGLSLVKEKSNTQIIFPNGAQYNHDATKPVLLTPKSSSFWNDRKS